ncbi:OmpW/AlkL family protein [Azohydromonas caseinilytica]
MQIGPARIDFHESAALAVAGAPVPGAGAKLQNNTTLAAEISHHFTPAWSAGLTVGVPARTRVIGTGAAEAFGEMGAGRYGPMALTVRYAFNDFGRWHPYIGTGITYFVMLKEYDSFIKDLKIDNAFGGVIQFGIHYNIDSHLGLFIDAKKLFVKTSATGNLPALAGAPLNTNVKLNPAVLHAGILFRF